MKRPFAVTVLAVISVIAGLIAVLDVFRYFGFTPFSPIGRLEFFNVNFFGAFLSGVVALIWFSVARQLWNLDPRGWLFVVTIAILYLVFAFVAMLGNNPFQNVSPAIIISALALILAILPGTKAAFGQ